MKVYRRFTAVLAGVGIALLSAHSQALPIVYSAFARGEVYLIEADDELTITPLAAAPPPFDPVEVFADGFGDFAATASGEVTVPPDSPPASTPPAPVGFEAFLGEQEGLATGIVGSMGSLAASSVETTMIVEIRAPAPPPPDNPQDPVPEPDPWSATFRYVTTLDILATDPLGTGESVFAGAQAGLSLTGGELDIELGPIVAGESSTSPSLLAASTTPGAVDPASPPTFFVAGLSSPVDGPEALSIVYIDFTITLSDWSEVGGFVTGADATGFAEAIPAPSVLALMGFGLLLLRLRRQA